jgi:tetratricopeptide (TPR) repeat protein
MTTAAHLGKVLKIFYAYARQDKKFRDNLNNHLSILQRQGLIVGWHADQIEIGGEQADLLKKHLQQADIILLLISSDFVASDNCYCIEMQLALERHERKEAYVIPVLLRPAAIADLPFARLRPLPPDGRPIAEYRNRDRAFAQVAQALKALVETISQQLPSEPVPFKEDDSAPRWWKVPYAHNTFFVGRAELLEQLYKAWQANQTGVFVQSLNGMGGIGKTQIALEYAYRYARSYQAVFWVAADPQGDLLADFVRIADVLDLPEKNEAEQARIVAALKRWFQQNTDWLLIFDNVEDLTALHQLLPAGQQGHVLLTTRAQAMGNLAHPYEVTSFDLREGTQLLLQRVRLLPAGAALEQVERQYKDAAEEITRQFDGHPLALDQAGAYLEETQQSLLDYLELFKRRKHTLLNRRGEHSADHQESVMTTFSLALERVSREYPAAVELLRFCAFLHPDAQPEELLMAGARSFAEPFQELASDSFALSDALAVLRKYSLVRRHPATRTVSVHRLVQEVVRQTLEREQQRHLAEMAVNTLSREFPSNEPAFWQQCQRYLPHARVGLQLVADWQMRSIEAVHLANRVGDYLYKRAEFAEAQSCYEQALGLLTEEEEPLFLAQVLSNLGVLHLMQAHYVQAEPYLQRCLSLRERLLPSTDPLLAQSLNDLAGLYHNQGQYASAESFYQRALALLAPVPGAEDAQAQRILSNLALLYYTRQQYAESEALNARVLAVRETQDQQSAETGQSLLNLGYVYYKQQRYDEAGPLFTRALALYEALFGPDHPQTATALNACALLALARRQDESAAPLFKRALAIWEEKSGPAYPRLIGVLHALALIALHQGEAQEAENLLRRALQIQQQTSWLEFTNLEPAFRELLNLYERQQNAEQADALRSLLKTLQTRAAEE